MCEVSRRPVCLCVCVLTPCLQTSALMVKHTAWLGALAKVLCNDRVKLRKNCKLPPTSPPPYLKTNCGSKSESVGSLNDKVGPFAPRPWHCRKGEKGTKGGKQGQKRDKTGMKVRRSPSRPYRIYWWLVRVSRLKWLRETTIKWALANHCQLQGRVIF